MDRTTATAAKRKARSIRASGPAADLVVTSELNPNEPVSEAEIRLVLAFLNDKIAQILDPMSLSCPAASKPRVG